MRNGFLGSLVVLLAAAALGQAQTAAWWAVPQSPVSQPDARPLPPGPAVTQAPKAEPIKKAPGQCPAADKQDKSDGPAAEKKDQAAPCPDPVVLDGCPLWAEDEVCPEVPCPPSAHRPDKEP